MKDSSSSSSSYICIAHAQLDFSNCLYFVLCFFVLMILSTRWQHWPDSLMFCQKTHETEHEQQTTGDATVTRSAVQTYSRLNTNKDIL